MFPRYFVCIPSSFIHGSGDVIRGGKGVYIWATNGGGGRGCICNAYMGANQCIKRFIIHGKLPLKYIFIVLHLTSKKHHHFWKSVFAYSLRSTALTRALFANWARGHGPWALWAMQNQSSIAGVAMQYKSIFGF